MHSITIEPCTDKELYVVRTSFWDDELGYIDDLHVVDADELGELLLQYMPYLPKKKKTQQPKTEKSNVRPFTRC
jgi:hypothetical protein|tara:strand:- start:157 stop:378 length:222 start_codon:yes stop_codon:yes gene_type:complete